MGERMKRLELFPTGFACTLKECPPGPFLHGEDLGFKSEYATDRGEPEAYTEAGEFFHGKGLVIPLEARWVDES